MKITVQVKVTHSTIITVEGETRKEIVHELGLLSDIFCNKLCGKCGGASLKFVSRKDAEENWYYEITCEDPKCRYVLPIHQNKKPVGGMYVERGKKDENGKWRPHPNSGWMPPYQRNQITSQGNEEESEIPHEYEF